MSQFADGGLMSTKPYISSSNYIMKMSDYKKGDWQKIWDGLYWRFIYKNQSFFQSNPRLSMMVRTLNKMDNKSLNLISKFRGIFIKFSMIYNSTYNDIEKEIETNNLVGKKFNLIKSIRLGGIGSKRLIVEDLSVNFKKMIQQKMI